MVGWESFSVAFGGYDIRPAEAGRPFEVAVRMSRYLLTFLRLRKAGFDGVKTTWFGELNQPIGRTKEVVSGQNCELQHLPRQKNSLVLGLVNSAINR